MFVSALALLCVTAWQSRRCDAGSYSEGLAVNCTKCAAGLYSGNAASGCTDCPAGSYSASEGTGVCGDCPGNTYSYSGATNCLLCLKGYYYGLDGECYECPEGSSCTTDGGSTQKLLLVEKNYWRISSVGYQVYSCPLKRSCQGGLNFTREGDGYCYEGFSGPLCAVCDEGYFKDTKLNTCSSCAGTFEQNLMGVVTGSPVLLTFFFCFVVAVIGVCKFMFTPPKEVEVDSVEQHRAFMDRFRKWKRLMKLTQLVGKIQMISKAMKVKVKCLTSFGQIAATIAVNLNIEFPPITTNVLGSFEVLNLDIVPSLGLQCRFQSLNYMDTVVSVTTFPMFVVAFLGIVFVYKLQIGKARGLSFADSGASI